jgi:hypothetical protein
MLKMQTFHDRLFAASHTDEPDSRPLRRVTEFQPGQLTSLRSTMSWDQWPSEVIERAAEI